MSIAPRLAASLLAAASILAAQHPTACAEPRLEVHAEPESRPPRKGSLTVVSLNLGKETDAARIAGELRRAGLLERTDVLALQEVQRDEPGAGVAERLAERLGMSVAVAGAGNGDSGENADAVALLSRHRLRDARAVPLPRNELGVRTRCRVAIAATVEGMRFVGLHLDTRVNTHRRLAQLDPALAAAEGFDGPVVLAGDFNTNRFYWLGRLIPVPFVEDQADAVFDHLVERGFQSPFAPGGPATNDFLGLQLDWVFLRGVEPSDAGVEPLTFTDHHAVWVRIPEQAGRRRASNRR